MCLIQKYIYYLMLGLTKHIQKQKTFVLHSSYILIDEIMEK